jgi:hypothetical protein
VSFGWPIYFWICMGIHVRPFWDKVCRTTVDFDRPEKEEEVRGFEVIMKEKDG